MLALLSSQRSRARTLVIGFSLDGGVVRLLWQMVSLGLPKVEGALRLPLHRCKRFLNRQHHLSRGRDHVPSGLA